MKDIYETITSHMIEALENADELGRWKAPWDGASAGMPVNVASGKLYRGINVLVLGMAGYDSPVFGTYKQWKAQGGSVQKGEKGTQIVFFKPVEKVKADGSKDKFLLARAYSVFNISQTDIKPEPVSDELRDPVAAHEAAEAFLVGTGADIRHGGNRAFYQPRRDEIHLPQRDAFHSTADYYSTALHELVHWSGSKKRLERDFSGRYGDSAYAFEELVAELGAAYACALTGVTKQPRSDHAKYLASWLKVLKGDKRSIFAAASKAQQAVDYLDGLQPEEVEQAA